MAPGKRKSCPSTSAPRDKTDDDDVSSRRGVRDAEAVFRRHFEAQFAPLDEEEEEEEEEEEADGWGGFSDCDGGGGGARQNGDDDDDDDDEDGDEDLDGDETTAVQVIDYSGPTHAPQEPRMSKAELKAFMSSRVLDHTTIATTTTTTSSSKPPAAQPTPSLPEDAPSLLAQDLQLRRLLAESHLLLSSSNLSTTATTTTTNPPLHRNPRLAAAGPRKDDAAKGTAAATAAATFSAGRARLRALDLRMRALGARASPSDLDRQRMPMLVRRRVDAAAAGREARRRREARENGIVLERSRGGSSKRESGRRRRGGGGLGRDRDGVGRLRGAELRISSADVGRIEGRRDAFGRC